MAADETVRIDTVGTSDVYVTSVKKAAAETKRLSQAQKQAVKDAKEFQAKVFTGAAAAATAVATGFVAAVKAQTDAVRELDRVAKSSTIATKTVAGLRIAAKELGQSLDSVVPVDLADKLLELREGNQTWIDDFAHLGLAAKDFEAVNWDVTKSLEIIVKAMGSVTDKSKAAGAASRIGSTAFENLFAVFGEGNATLEEYVKRAEESGFATEQAQENAKRMSAAMADMSLSVETATAKLTGFVAESGAFEDFARGLEYSLGKAGEAMDALVDSPMPRLYSALWDLSTKVIRPFVTDTGLAAEELKELAKQAKRAITDIGAEGDLQPQRLEGLEAELLLKKNLLIAEQERQAVLEMTGEAEEARQAWPKLLASLNEMTDYEAAAELMRIPWEAAIQALAKTEAAVEQSIDRTIIAEEEAARRRYMTQAEYYSSIAALALDSSDSIVQIGENLNVKNKGFLTAAFLLQRASAVGQASVLGILATQQALASAPPPYSFILAGITGTAAALNVAAIATTPAPTFHIGTRAGDLAPDERTVTRRESETAILTPQGVAAANAGRVQGDAPVYVLMDHEVVGRGAARAARRPGSAMYDALGRDLPGHSRRRTG